jgi:hypothetical protein
VGAARGADGGGVVSPAEKRLARLIARMKAGEVLTPEEREQAREACRVLRIG